MSAQYVRDYYGVTFKVGDRLTVDGRAGTLVSFPGQYLGVRFDGDKRTSRCHPTWRVRARHLIPAASPISLTSGAAVKSRKSSASLGVEGQ